MQQFTRKECMQESSKAVNKKICKNLSKRREENGQEKSKKEKQQGTGKKVFNKSSKELGKK